MAQEPVSKQSARGNYIAQADQGGTASVNVTIFHGIPPRQIDPAALETALQQLAALPLDTIPDVAPLPTGSRVPFSPNPLFVGREADLRLLANAIKGGETVAIGPIAIAATTGLGGIGKTQLA